MAKMLIVDFAFKGKVYHGVIYIRDGLAVYTCENWEVTKELYNKDKFEWDEKNKVITETFPDKDEKAIVKLMKERYDNKWKEI
jgi:hypothetical protein